MLSSLGSDMKISLKWVCGALLVCSVGLTVAKPTRDSADLLRAELKGADKKSTDSAPTEFPKGDADDNAATSEGITRVLKKCADQYATCQNFEATGTYIDATKQVNVRAQTDARMKIYFRRPKLMRVEIEGKDIASAFIADGTTVTMLWNREKKFLQFPQPASLAAFSEAELPGEILEDESNTLFRAIVPPLLMSDDPLGWLRANVDSFHYDGDEKVEGTPCYKIRFMQSNPDMVVINWIDKKTFFLRKVSLIRAVSQGGQMTGSLDDAIAAQVHLGILEKISTEAADVPSNVFDAKVPTGYKQTERKTNTPDQPRNESAWMRLFHAAASQTGRETSVSLVSDVDSDLLREGVFSRTTERLIGIGKAGDTASTLPVVASATASGKINFWSYDGENGLKSVLPAAPKLVQFAQRTSETIVLSVLQNDGIAAFSLRGRQLWKLPTRYDVADIVVRDSKTAGQTLIYACSSGGLMTLDLDGHVVFMTRAGVIPITVEQVNWEGQERLAGATRNGDISVYQPAGKFLSLVKYPDLLRAVLGDDEDSSAPLLGISTSDQRDLVLRRIGTDGSIAWTVGVAQSTEGVKSAILQWAKQGPRPAAKADDGTTGSKSEPNPITRRYAAIALSDGRISLFSPDGDPVWRGKLTLSDEALVPDAKNYVQDMTAADLNADGTDELYFATDIGVVQLLLQPVQ